MSSRAAIRAAGAAADRQRLRRRRMRRWRRVAYALVALLLVVWAARLSRETRPRSVIPLGSPLPPFALVDQDQHPVTRESLAGRAVVFDFAFFHDLLHSSATMRQMGTLGDDVRDGPLAGHVVLLTLTAAPHEDTPDHLSAVATSVEMTPPWSVVSGPEDQVIPLLDSLDVDWRRLQDERAKYGAPIFPDDRMMLVDGKGFVRGEYDRNSWTDMMRLRAELAVVAR